MRNLLILGVVILGMGWFALGVVHREFAMPPGDCTELENIRIDSADYDANAALEAKDFRLLAVDGLGHAAPGLPAGAILDRYKLRLIACTGNVAVSEWHLRLIKDARVYAERYNAIILRALSENAER